MSSIYRDVLYRNYSESFGSQKIHNPALQYAQYEVTYPNVPSDKSLAIVDLGCGKGEWLTWLAGKGFTQLTGVDGSPSDLTIARAQSPTISWVQANLLDFMKSAAPGTFDLIHAKDVIEHLTKDEFIAFLQSSHRLLRPGGRVWLQTFNAQSPLSAATRYGDFTHESGHTPASLAQCLRACGFGQMRIEGRHYHSQSLSGRVRGLLGKVYYRGARLALTLRHGSGSAMPGVDLHSVLPDVFAEGIRNTELHP